MPSLSRTPHLDAMLKTFFSNIVRHFVLTLVLIAVLSQFGIQTTSLVTVFGAAGLAIGSALQGTLSLSHLAAGVMLLIFPPFRIGPGVGLPAKASVSQRQSAQPWVGSGHHGSAH